MPFICVTSHAFLQGNSNSFLLLFSAEHGNSEAVKTLIEASTSVRLYSSIVLLTVKFIMDHFIRSVCM